MASEVLLPTAVLGSSDTRMYGEKRIADFIAQHEQFLSEPSYRAAWNGICARLLSDKIPVPATADWVRDLQKILDTEASMVSVAVGQAMHLRPHIDTKATVISVYEIAAYLLQNNRMNEEYWAVETPANHVDFIVSTAENLGTAVYRGDGKNITFYAENYVLGGTSRPDLTDPKTRIVYRHTHTHEAAHAYQDLFLQPFVRNYFENTDEHTQPENLKTFLEDVLDPAVLRRIDMDKLFRMPLRDAGFVESIADMKETQAEAVAFKVTRNSSKNGQEKLLDVVSAVADVSRGRAEQRARLIENQNPSLSWRYSVGSFFLRRAAAMGPAVGFPPTAFATLSLWFPELVPQPGELPPQWVQRCTQSTTGIDSVLYQLRRYDRTYLAVLPVYESRGNRAQALTESWPNPDGTYPPATGQPAR